MQRAFVLGSMTVMLGACTPTFNWRDVRIADKGLVALLPCKADRATRSLPLGTESVEIQMAGCEAGNATFAVAHASAGSAAQAEAWLRAWQAATRSQLGDAEVIDVPAAIARASALPAPWRLEARGASSTHVQWFSQRTTNGVSVYQATILGKPSSPEAVATFFEGLRLP